MNVTIYISTFRINWINQSYKLLLGFMIFTGAGRMGSVDYSSLFTTDGKEKY